MDTQYDLLLTGGTVLTLDSQRRVLEPGAVAVTDDRIVAVGPVEEFEQTSATRIIDCTGSAIMPGFVDCHDHMEQGIVKGLGEGEAVWEWLTTLIFPLGDFMTVEEAVAATRYASFESVRAGITCVINNQYLPWDPETTDAVATAMESVGLRGVVARGMTGTPPPAMTHRGDDARPWTYSTAEELQIMRDLLDNWSPDRLVRLWPGPNNLVFNDQELIRGCVELAREYGTKWHTHCCEAQPDPEIYNKTYGMSPVKWLGEAGLLGPEATLAHTIWVSDEDIELLAASGTASAHNPVSNMYVASGAMRLGKFLEVGVTVGLGIDGSAVGHRIDPFETMKQTVFIQRLDSLDPAACRSEVALELGTRGGGAFTGFDIGSLETGKLADIVEVDLTGTHCGPRPRAVSAVVNSVGPSDVKTVIIDGQIVVDGGRCTTIDEAAVTQEARRAMDNVAKRAGFERYLEPWIAS
jgi:5-methylthioadenosine/S-adenosylhomocysteine deaminase